MRKLTSLTFISTAVLSGMLLTNSNIVKADTANTIGEGNSPAVNTQTTSNSVSDNKSTSIDSKQTTKATDTQTKSNGTDSTSSNQPTDQTKRNSTDSTDSKKATDTTETKHKTTPVSFTASTDATKTIFNNNNSSVAQSTYNGIVHATGFANADSNTLSTSAAILNVEKSDGKFNIVEKIANTTDKDAYVDFYIAAPSQANTIKAVIDSSKMSGFTSGLKNEVIQVSYTPGNYQTVNLSDVDWSKVIYVKISGIAEAGKIYTTALPVEISNYDEVKANLPEDGTANSSDQLISSSDLLFMWQLNSDGSKGTFIGGDVANNIQLRLAKPNTSAITELENTKAISAYDSIRNEDGQLEYKYDGEATDLLGNNTSIDSSFFEIHKLGAYLSSDNKLYEDIEYSINLDKIQAVLSKYGYSVNVDSNNNFWPYYTYSKHSTDNPSFDDDSKVSDDTSSNSDLYIEVQKVLVTQPVSLYVGDELDPTQISDDNPLMKAHIKFTNIDKANNTTTTKEKDLTVDGKTLTVSAVDAKGNSVDLDKITTKAGTYTLTYTYHLNNGTITNTSTVTVLDKKENPYHDKVATHKYVIRFVSNNKVVKTVTVEGQPDDEIDLTKKQQTVPEGYKLAKGQTVPDFVTIKDTDKTIDIKVVKDTTTPVTPTDDPVVHVYFVDKKTGKTIKTVTKNGKVGETVNLTSDEQAIPNNYKLVAGSTIPTSITLTKDIKDITVYLEAEGQTKTDDTHKSENNEDNNHEADNHKEVINKKSEDNTPKNPIKENTTEKTFNKVATKSESAEVKTQVVVSKKQKAINGVQTKLAKATNNENKLPQTGNHDMILALIGLGLTTFAGITLKKKH